MLYVGDTTSIFKLNAGAPSALPTLVDTLTFDGNVDGTYVFGLVLDTKNGYGEWEGRNQPQRKSREMTTDILLPIF